MATSEIDQTAQTDVLVVGGGIAGSRAAIEAKTYGAQVLMIVKGIYGCGGCSLSPSTASAIGPWSDPKDSVQRHFSDIVINAKQYLCDQELASIQALEGGERLLELERWGLRWDREPDGKISLFPSSKLGEPGQAPIDRWISVNRRGSHAEGPFWTGHSMLDALRDQVNREDIPLIQETIVAQILVSNNQVTGAIAYDYLNARTILIKCSIAIIATGDASQIYYPNTMVSGEGTGDGFSLAYEAGAQLANMEQFEYMAFDYAYPDSARGKAALENVAESGEMAYLRNRLGERFMQRYNPQGIEWSTQEDLAKAIWQEVKEGRGGPHGGVYLDLRHIPYNIIAKGAPERLEQMERLGYDVSKDLIEVYPAIHTTSGGIRIDRECQTRVRGLFAAGQVAFAVGDCLVEGGTGCVDAMVWGKRSGEFAAKHSRVLKKIEPNEAEALKRIQILRAPLEFKGGIPPVRIIRKLQQTMWKGASMIKSSEGLTETLEKLHEIQTKDLPQMCIRIRSGRFNIEMREAIELCHMLRVGEMIVRSSLMRKESRNRFQRSDYPNRDDEHWLRHILIEKDANEMKLTTVPVEFLHVKYGKGTTS